MGMLQNLIVKLSPVLPYVLAGVFGLILIIVLILLLIFRSAKKDSLPPEAGQEAFRDPEDLKQEAPAAQKAKLSGLKLRQSFKQALKLLKTNLSGRNYQYQIPWLLMVGEDGSGKTTALQNSGLNLSLGILWERGLKSRRPATGGFLKGESSLMLPEIWCFVETARPPMTASGVCC